MEQEGKEVSFTHVLHDIMANQCANY